MRRMFKILAGLALAAWGAGEIIAAELLREQAAAALRRGVDFFVKEVSVQGTYLWQYSEDLAKREGEGKATATQGWVQPPGTPSVGEALLTAWEATGEPRCRDAVRQTALALARGQLRSGGWTYFIDFDPQSKRPLAYRLGGVADKKARNWTTLDDDTTQSAARFLMRADQAFEFREPAIHEAVKVALESLLKAQFPNGAWPQGFEEFPDPARYPVKKAAYPEAWSRAPDVKEYWRFYTFNDNLVADLIETLFAAAKIYQPPATNHRLQALGAACRAAAEKAGDFILLAQMPEPQPAWAQQYNFEMHPAWARKFEPPSVTGGESQGLLRVLLGLYRRTGQAKYLEPIPRALDYLRRSRLPNGRLARFYELRTNRPLYFTKDYQLTYDAGDVPTHYAFVVDDRTDSLAREFEELRRLDPATLAAPRAPARPRASPALEAQVRQIIAAQDARGRWVEEGRLKYHGGNDPTTRIIRSQTFSRNIETLSQYLRATQ